LRSRSRVIAALLGCIADDFTGGTDLAAMLVKHGMRTVQMIGVPRAPLPADIDAVVVALKSRTAPAAEAVAESLAALEFLRSEGCRQFYFKYCSTFDSTPRGNIGPVADALLDALGADFTIACPAFPANARTIYKGNLFVGDVLLSESGMRNHPLTPMTDANLVRVLQAQTRRKVGLVDYSTVAKGAAAIASRFDALREAGHAFAIVDAISDPDLAAIGEACADMRLVTGGSGAALGLPDNFRKRGLLRARGNAAQLPAIRGFRAVVSGSCSVATNGQVAVMRETHDAFKVDPMALGRGENVAAAALDWARERVRERPVLIYATETPEEVKAAQSQFGVERTGSMVEQALAIIASGLVEAGVRQLVVAGGETSGAVVKALGVEGLLIGPEIDPGVPWTVTIGSARPLALALKSGNFGTPDFFLKAWDRLQ
jgi:uncharacterized protein YgbK (DUF1537 family)